MLASRPDGRWDLNLGAPDRDLLAALADQLLEMLDEEPDDPALRRLAPTAYLDDPEREAEFQLLAGDELRASRRASLEVACSVANATVLDDAEVTAFVQAVNALRLVVGTRLDVAEDDDGPTGPDDPDARLWFLYDFLNHLLYNAVDSLSSKL